LLSIYPEFDWIIWKFETVAKRFWRHYEGESDAKFLHEMSNSFHIRHLDEWYRVSRKELQIIGAERFVKKRGGLMKLLSEVYPNYKWNNEKFLGKQKKSSQWWLYKTLKETFPPGIEILEEYQLPAMLFIQTGCLMLFDIFVPSLNIIIEYHGFQHFHDHYMFGDVKSCKEQDDERIVACASQNITYLEVPYWWKHDKESIIALVNLVRPDIVADCHLITPFHQIAAKLSELKIK